MAKNKMLGTAFIICFAQREKSFLINDVKTDFNYASDHCSLSCTCQMHKLTGKRDQP